MSGADSASSRTAVVSLLAEDRAVSDRVKTALADSMESDRHAPFSLQLFRPPFDLVAALDADCILVEAALPNLDRVLHQWRPIEPEARPPLFLLMAKAHDLSPDASLDADAVLPIESATLLRRVVETVVDNRRLHGEVEELARFAALGRTLAGVLHELKNPLSNVLGGLERIRTLTPMDDSVVRWFGIVERNGALLREALADLLDGFRFNLELKPAPLHSILDRAIAYAVAGDVNVRSRIAVEKQYDARTPTVVGNAGQLLHVFLNLLVNSRQALGDRPGAIVVKTRWPEDRVVEVEIVDNGPGIAEDLLPHLFKKRRTTKRSGSGFGLSLVHEVVTRHGGAIEAYNGPGGGACFRTRLPADAV